MTDTTAIDIDALNKAVTEAQDALAKANEEAATKVAAIMAVQPIDFIALASASHPVTTATNALVRAKDALATATANTRWNESITVREPIIDALRETLIDTKISAALLSVTGSIVVTDGKAVLTLNPVFDKPTLASVIEGVTAMIDADALVRLEIPSLDVRVTDIDKENAVISLAPSGSKAVKATTAKSSEPRAEGSKGGDWEYIYQGKALSSRAFLEQLEAENAPFVEKRAQSFQTALHGTGNGLANLARDAAAFMNVDRRQKVEA